MRRQSYTKYRRAFGITYTQIRKMTREEFTERYGKKFKYMSDSKFLKTIGRIASAYERGEELLKQYR